MQAATPERRIVQVILTDGRPTACSGFDDEDVFETLVQMAGAPSYISTFAIGIFADEEGRDVVRRLAESGGTNAPIVIDPDRPNLSDALGTALTTIGETVVACQTPLPDLSADPDALALALVTRSDRVGVAHVRGASDCDPVSGGWCFEPGAGPRPTWLRLCPHTCGRVQSADSLELIEACEPIRDDY